MMLPKIEICIEGYNIEQTDFYIAHLIDKYNALNELYKKSCEHIVFLEKECKDGFYSALAESEKRILDKIDSLESRLADVESSRIIKDSSSDSMVIDNEPNTSDLFKEELSDFHSDLEDIKSLFSK